MLNYTFHFIDVKFTLNRYAQNVPVLILLQIILFTFQISVMTVRLSAIFEEHMDKIIHNWKMTKKRTSRRRNRLSSSNSEISVNQSSSSSEEEPVVNLTLVSQEDMYSDDDDTPLNILRSKQNTESDSTSQSIDKLRVKSRRSHPDSEEDYEPAVNYNNVRRRHFNSSSSEEDEENGSSSNNEHQEGPFNRKSLRERPVRKRTLLYESSDSDTNSSVHKRKKRIRKSSGSESESKTSRTNLNDTAFISGISSRGRVRKMTERAKALFGKR